MSLAAALFLLHGRLGGWTHRTCPGPPCSQQPLSRSALVPIQTAPGHPAPLLPVPTARSYGAAPGSCLVSAFLRWTLLRPRCRAFGRSDPVLKFPKVPRRVSCLRLSMRGAEGAAPVAPGAGGTAAGVGSRSGAGDTGMSVPCVPSCPSAGPPPPPADEQGVERPAAQASLPLRGTSRCPGPPAAPPGRPVCSLVPGGLGTARRPH